LHQTGEIDFQEIAFDEAHVVGKTGRKARDKVSIEFNRDHPARSCRQWQGEGAAAGADFEECVVG
jgi:hypothetical protein